MGNGNSRSLPEAAKVKYNSEELTSYEAACLEDRDLRSFDADLHSRTSHVINTIAEGAEVRALSFNSFKEVTSCLLDMNQQVSSAVLDRMFYHLRLFGGYEPLFHGFGEILWSLCFDIVVD